MQKNYDFNRYSPSNFDEHLCLKPPLMLWICIVYLSRAVTLPFVIGLSSLGRASDTMQFVHGLFSVNTLLPSFVAVLVLCALIRRSPSGPTWARWLWMRGRMLLAFSAVLDLTVTLLGSPIFNGQEQLAGPVATWLLIGTFDLYFLAYILASQRVRDTFASFPAAAESTSG